MNYRVIVKGISLITSTTLCIFLIGSLALGQNSLIGNLAQAVKSDIYRLILPAASEDIAKKSDGADHQSAVPAIDPPRSAAAPPTLDNYADTSVALSGNATIAPSAAPSGAIGISVSTDSRFKGILSADSVTGAVRITNAQPAGTYTVTVKAFDNSGAWATQNFTLTVTSGAACNGASNFVTAGENSVNPIPSFVAIGDFNHDGNQDFAATSNDSNVVAIRLGNGAGGFAAPASVAVGAVPQSIALGDFNADGNQDFLTANNVSSDVSIRLGDGTGNFASPAVPEIAVGDSPSSVVAGDFNADGKLDFLATNEGSNSVSVRLGDGAGAFASTTEISVGTVPESIAVGDFNGDGKADFATTNLFGNNVSIRLGDGAGNFTSPTAAQISVGGTPYSVAVGDFNNDDNQDLVVANGGSNNVSIRLGNGAGGFVSPAAPQISVGANPRQIVVADFNNDGKLDFATANRGANNVSIRFGDGAGAFTLPATPQLPVGAEPNSIAIGDFNNNGKQDFAAANLSSDNISVRLGGACLAPEVNVKGNGVNIVSGSSTASSNDDTYFNTAIVNSETVSHTFTIENAGNTALNLNGTPKVTLGGANPSDFSITAQPSSPLAANGSTTFTVRFAPGATAIGERSAIVIIPNDDADENPYTFVVQGVGIAGAQVNLSVSSNPTTENPTSAITVTATASNPLPTAQTVNLAFTGTATRNEDYIMPATLTIPANQTVGTATLTTVNDNFYEGNETATLTISSITGGATIGATPAQTINIADDETPPTISINDISLTEGSSGTKNFTFTAVLSGATQTPVSFDYQTADGTAVSGAGGDYVSKNGTLTFSGVTPLQISIAVNGDTIIESNETFFVNLMNATINATFADAQGQATILDDDDTTPPETTITANPPNPSDSASASFTFSATDNYQVAGFECELDGGGFAACVSPKIYPDLTEGLHTFRVRAKDPAGNVDPTPAAYAWTIDVNAPDTSIDSAPPNPSGTTSATFTFSGSDSGSGVAGFECSLDNAAFTACASPVDYTNLPSGARTFRVRAVDATGKTDPTPAAYTWTINLLPTISANSGISRTKGNAANVIQIATVSDPDQAANTLSVTATPLSGADVTVGTISVDAAGSVFAEVSASCAAIDSTFALVVTDAGGATATANLNVAVTDSPTATQLAFVQQPTDTLPGGIITPAITVRAKNQCGANVSGYTGAVNISLASGSGTLGGTTIVNAVNGVATFSDLTVSGGLGERTLMASALDVSNTISSPFRISIQLSPATLPNGLLNTFYDQTISAAGGVAPYGYTYSGNLPNGLTLSNAGALSGTPTQLGNFSFTITATDANGNSTSRNYAVSINIYPNANVALSGSATVTPASAPAGAARLNASTDSRFKGVLSANPATGAVTVTDAHPAGTFPVTVRAFDDGGGAIVSTLTFNLTVSTGTACGGNPAFVTPMIGNSGTVAIGSEPISIAVGDFNKDGKQDFAATNGVSNNVSVRLGSGNGFFTSPAVAELPVGSFPYSVAVGDFNGDGNQDFAAANLGSASVSIRLGNGAGAFTLPAAPEVSVGSFPASIALGDFNADGKVDFVTGNQDNVSLRLGDGAGGFIALAVSEIVSGSSFVNVAVGDFNNDGKQDIAATDITKVLILLGDGAGGFSSAPDVPVLSNTRSAALGDFNNDGNQDLVVVSDYPSYSASIRLGTGTGEFVRPAIASVPVSQLPRSIAIGDFNNDGNQDFASVGEISPGVSVQFGNGAGGFAPPSFLQLSFSGGTYAIAVADFNNDGKQDFAAVGRNSGNITIRLGACQMPEINMKGNGVSIVNGDPTPSAFDNTDFGFAVPTTETASRTFTVENIGVDNLFLTGSPVVVVSGANAGDFSVTTQPLNGIAPNSSRNFIVRFAPSSIGLKTAVISIPNTDPNENPYTFTIQGVGGVQPTITSANQVTFDSNQYRSFTVTTTGTPLSTLSYTGSLPPGVGFADNGNGTATIAGTPTRGGNYPITITANNGGSATQSFTLTVTSPPTAAMVQISGRILSQNGRGLPNAFVTLSGGWRQTLLIVKTNPFGYYRLPAAEVGATYVLSVSAKGRTFNPSIRIVNLYENISDADFISEQ